MDESHITITWQSIEKSMLAYLGSCVEYQLEFLRDLGQEVYKVWSQRSVDCHEATERRRRIVQQIV